MTSWKIVDGMKGGGLLEEGVDLVPLVAISVSGSGTLSHWWLSQPAKPSSPTTSSCCLQWTSSTVALSLLFEHMNVWREYGRAPGMVVGTANVVTSYSWQHPLLFMESRTGQEKWEEKRKRNIHMDTTDTHTQRY